MAIAGGNQTTVSIVRTRPAYGSLFSQRRFICGQMANMATTRRTLFHRLRQHRDWAMLDQPPLVPLLASLMHALFPNSLTSFVWSGAGSCRTVALTAETARKLGGGKWAQLLAGMAAFLCPLLLAFGTIFLHGLASIESLGCSVHTPLIGIVRDDNDRWWLR